MRSELKKELARVKPGLKFLGSPDQPENQDEIETKLKKDISAMRAELSDLITAIKRETDEARKEA